MCDGYGLVGDKCRLDPGREVRRDFRHGLLNAAPEGEDIAPLAHRDGKPDAVPSVHAKDRLCRIGRTPRHMRYVSEPDGFSVRNKIDGQEVALRLKRTGNTDEDFLVAGLHCSRRDDGVLGLQRGDQRSAVNAKSRQLLGRKLDIDALILRAQDIDFRDVRQLEQLLADPIDVIPQLAMGEPVRREAVDDAVSVAKLIVETRPTIPWGSVLRMSASFLRT
jgi:hypothetical protein